VSRNKLTRADRQAMWVLPLVFIITAFLTYLWR
jgi:hypothetical protein